MHFVNRSTKLSITYSQTDRGMSLISSVIASLSSVMFGLQRKNISAFKEQIWGGGGGGGGGAKIWLLDAHSKLVLRLITRFPKFSFSQSRGRFEVLKLVSTCWNQNLPISDGYRVCSSLLKVLRILTYRFFVTVAVVPHSSMENGPTMPLIAVHTVHLGEISGLVATLLDLEVSQKTSSSILFLQDGAELHLRSKGGYEKLVFPGSSPVS